ncbi:MAG: hypothetical protein KIT15_02450 [Xanthobacteraceae bacterium]|nr:hypothetical protein [Xanthobacteraceae bacterium]MCW5673415.1 hypothetical protein [Xanthobacteraceae bacterium]
MENPSQHEPNAPGLTAGRVRDQAKIFGGRLRSKDVCRNRSGAAASNRGFASGKLPTANSSVTIAADTPDEHAQQDSQSARFAPCGQSFCCVLEAVTNSPGKRFVRISSAPVAA